MSVILPNVDIDVYYLFWGKSKHTHVRVQTHTISYMHVRPSYQVIFFRPEIYL